MPDAVGIQTPGLREFQRDLRQMEPEVAKELTRGLREAAKPVLARGRALAPRDTGALARSLRISVRSRGVSIGSRLPYAEVQHWGGRVGRNRSVRVRETLFLSRAVEEQTDRIVDELGDAVERAADRAGWR